VLVAGEPEMATWAQRLRDGVPIPEEFLEQLREVAKRAGVRFILAS
jgi:LDH2 family malate/lactate/ureidoglycolate dehydrogenase